MLLNEEECLKFLTEADEEMQKLADASMIEKYEDKNTFEICKKLVEAVKQRMNEECDAYVIGQKAMGLGDMKGDFTVFLDIGQNRFFAERKYKENVNAIKKLENVLKRDPEWKIVRLNHAVPSLVAVYLPAKQKCDLSVTNGFSVQISAMIGHFFEIQPEAIKLYHFMRNWLRINGVIIKDFVLTSLVMNYLQENNLMPSAFRAQQDVPQNFIEGIPVSFDPNRDINSYGIKKMPYYYSHVRGFFRYYSNFNFIDNVISTYYGYPVQKDEYEPRLDYDTPMCIAAFLNQKCNISRKISEAQVHKFMTLCSASHKYLADNNY